MQILRFDVAGHSDLVFDGKRKRLLVPLEILGTDATRAKFSQP